MRNKIKVGDIAKVNFHSQTRDNQVCKIESIGKDFVTVKWLSGWFKSQYENLWCVKSESFIILSDKEAVAWSI